MILIAKPNAKINNKHKHIEIRSANNVTRGVCVCLCVYICVCMDKCKLVIPTYDDFVQNYRHINLSLVRNQHNIFIVVCNIKWKKVYRYANKKIESVKLKIF